MKFNDYLQWKDLSDAAFGKQMQPVRTKSTVRNWRLGVRTPRPNTQAEIMQLTNGIVTGNDWLPDLTEQKAA